MKRILLIALSTVSLGGTLFAFFKKDRKQSKMNNDDFENADNRRERHDAQAKPGANAMGMSVKRDGSLDMRSHGRKRSSKHAAATAVHLRKDGSPDRRYKENR